MESLPAVGRSQFTIILVCVACIVLDFMFGIYGLGTNMYKKVHFQHWEF